MPKAKNTALDTAIGARVRALRVGYGMNQTTLGGHLGVTFQQVQKVESGVNKFSVGQLLKIADLFGTTVGTLIGQGLADTKDKSRTAPLMVQMLGIKGGADLAEAFLAIKNYDDRRTLLRVARGLGK